MANNNTIQQTKAEISQTLLNPLSLLGYILGGLSLLNLVREFNIVKLYGIIKDWVDAFDYFILGVRDFLFGWIKFTWLTITDVESYFLAVFFLFVSSYLRALLTDHTSRTNAYSQELKHSAGLVVAGIMLSGLLFYSAIFLILALIALIMPAIITEIAFSIFILFTAIWMLNPKDTDNIKAVIRARLNLVGSVVVFLILVAINYGFKP